MVQEYTDKGVEYYDEEKIYYKVIEEEVNEEAKGKFVKIKIQLEEEICNSLTDLNHVSEHTKYYSLYTISRTEIETFYEVTITARQEIETEELVHELLEVCFPLSF